MSRIDHFGIIAPFYDRMMRNSTQNEWSRTMDLTPGMRILDACGGTGRVAEQFSGRGCQVVVADESFAMLRYAVGKPNLGVVRTYVEKLPWGDDIFDRIFMVDALHHVANQDETVGELWRILKPGGRIFIEEPDIQVFGIKILALGEKLMGMRSHFIDAQTIKTKFNKYTDQILVNQKDGTLWIMVSKG